MRGDMATIEINGGKVARGLVLAALIFGTLFLAGTIFMGSFAVGLHGDDPRCADGSANEPIACNNEARLDSLEASMESTVAAWRMMAIVGWMTVVLLGVVFVSHRQHVT